MVQRFENPGTYLTGGNRLAAMLLADRFKEPKTHSQGLANIAMAGMGGWMQGRDRKQQEAVTAAFTNAMKERGPPDGPPSLAGPPPTTMERLQRNLGQIDPNNPYLAQTQSTLFGAKVAKEAQASELARAATAEEALYQRRRPDILEDYLYQQTHKAFRPVPKVPGRDIPYPQDVHGQLVQIAGAEAEATYEARIAAQGKWSEVEGEPGVQVNSVTGERRPSPVSAEEKFEAKKVEMFPKARGALKSLERQTEIVTSTISSALNLISPWSTSWGSFLSGFPAVDARKLENLITTIKANVGFDALSDMRQNSPTGGALGSVSEIENKLLQATKGTMDPKDPEGLMKTLTEIRDLYIAVLEEKNQQFSIDYKNQLQGNPIISDEDLLKKYLPKASGG
jgi:hypothetical protein